MSLDSTRRRFMESLAAAGLSGTFFPGALLAQHVENDLKPITLEMIRNAEWIAGIEFTDGQRRLMLEDLNEALESYHQMRMISVPNSVSPSHMFDPRIGGVSTIPGEDNVAWTAPLVEVGNADTLAFLTVSELSSLLRDGKVTCTDLTELYLSRLKQFDSILEAVVTLTEDRAREQADAVDRDLRAGNWRGPLHGIPWGAKDLLAVNGYPTTWGTEPYRKQRLEKDATVVRRLDEAGAVLITKLALGELAWGDVWYGGQTRNPWNIEEGSSGSSAGSGAAVAAGLVGFAIGSETLGSIVSPSTRNGVTGFRPSFGRVSRHGAMALAWSMDKLGPMARSAEDCALVFAAIHGWDENDSSTVTSAFRWDSDFDATRLRVGYLAAAFERDYPNQAADAATLQALRNAGIRLAPVSLPDYPTEALTLTLSVEAAAAFDELARSGDLDTMKRQERYSWPNVFRWARLVPAVEFVQASRIRTLLMREMAELMDDYDVVVSPSFGGDVLRITNLTGHPCVTVPNVFHRIEEQPDSPRRSPGSISFIGGLYKDAEALLLAHSYQKLTDFHRQRPPIK